MRCAAFGGNLSGGWHHCRPAVRGKRKILCKVALGQRRGKSWITIRGREMAIPATHPGEHLGDESEELEISTTALGRLIEVPTNRITEILNGQRSVTGDTSLRLGRFFGTSAEVLAESPESIRAAAGRTEDRGPDRVAADIGQTGRRAEVLNPTPGPFPPTAWRTAPSCGRVGARTSCAPSLSRPW